MRFNRERDKESKMNWEIKTENEIRQTEKESMMNWKIKTENEI